MAQNSKQPELIGRDEHAAALSLAAYVYSEPQINDQQSGTIVNFTGVHAGRKGYTYYRVSVFGPAAVALAEMGEKEFGPGSRFFAIGELEQTFYTNQEGQTRSSLSVSCRQCMIFTGADGAIIEDVKSSVANMRGDREDDEKPARRGSNRRGR